MTPLDQYRRLEALIPRLPGWLVSMGPPPSGKSPPWIVATISPVSASITEALSVSNTLWRVDIRVVAATAESVIVACTQMQSALDGAWPGQGFSRLVPEKDSGVYASELANHATGSPYMMRVLTWTVGSHQ